MPKYLLLFSKDEPVRWLGHLDILRTFERAIRRATLPIAFSSGFNPREKIAFASALGTGITGEAERAVMELTEERDPEAIAVALNETLPSGLRIRHCEPISGADEKSTLSGYDRGEYEVTMIVPESATAEDLDIAIQGILDSPTLPIEREKEKKVKTVDIRPNLFTLELVPDTLSSGRARIRMIVAQGESGTAKPAEVIGALSKFLPGVALRRSHRVRQIKGADERVAVEV